MGDAPGHVTPGGHALRADQIGHVVKGHHIAFARAVLIAPGCDTDQKAILPPAPGDLDFILNGVARPVWQFVKELCKFWNGGVEV